MNKISLLFYLEKCKIITISFMSHKSVSHFYIETTTKKDQWINGLLFRHLSGKVLQFVIYQTMYNSSFIRQSTIRHLSDNVQFVNYQAKLYNCRAEMPSKITFTVPLKYYLCTRKVHGVLYAVQRRCSS